MRDSTIREKFNTYRFADFKEQVIDLLAASEAYLREIGVEFLQVKTLSARHPDEGYGRTRKFYLAMGFRPLEGFPTLWGKANPCLQLIKKL